MYTRLAFRLFPLVVLFAGACGPLAWEPPEGGPVVIDRGGPAAPEAADAPQPLGSQGMIGYRVLAGAAAEIPGGDLGYVITANGRGGYTLVWTDTEGSNAEFSGTITTDGDFDPSQTVDRTGYAGLRFTAANQLSFDSSPGADVDGIDLVSSTDPIYLDLYVNGQPDGFGIYFTGADSGVTLTSSYNPVAFTSP